MRLFFQHGTEIEKTPKYIHNPEQNWRVGQSVLKSLIQHCWASLLFLSCPLFEDLGRDGKVGIISGLSSNASGKLLLQMSRIVCIAFD